MSSATLRCPECHQSFRVMVDEQMEDHECPHCGFGGGQVVYGECAGCQEKIIEGEDYYEVELSHGVTEKVHQKAECCMDYVEAMSYCRTAGA